MNGERSISDRLVDELSGVIRVRQASLAIRIVDFCEASWHTEDRITPDQIRELVEIVLESFEDVRGEIQGAIEIDAALFTRGMDALRQAELEDGEA